MAEDTWALNEGVIDEQGFLDQAYLMFAERKSMFLNALERPAGAWWLACSTPPTASSTCSTGTSKDAAAIREISPHHRGAISADGLLVGAALEHVDEETVLFVFSDHGFCSFRRGLNLNSWLLENGYLALKNGAGRAGHTSKAWTGAGPEPTAWAGRPVSQRQRARSRGNRQAGRGSRGA